MGAEFRYWVGKSNGAARTRVGGALAVAPPALTLTFPVDIHAGVVYRFGIIMALIPVERGALLAFLVVGFSW